MLCRCGLWTAKLYVLADGMDGGGVDALVCLCAWVLRMKRLDVFFLGSRKLDQKLKKLSAIGRTCVSELCEIVYDYLNIT